jgi:hypothetical protein
MVIKLQDQYIAFVKSLANTPLESKTAYPLLLAAIEAAKHLESQRAAAQ